jgi:hypothetical protein
VESAELLRDLENNSVQNGENNWSCCITDDTGNNF